MLSVLAQLDKASEYKMISSHGSYFTFAQLHEHFITLLLCASRFNRKAPFNVRLRISVLLNLLISIIYKGSTNYVQLIACIYISSYTER